MLFFIDNIDKYQSDSVNGLRICQLGAIWSIKSHFTISNNPALVSLPTGSGKTALMMALSFELTAKKVLIITPSQVIRHQTNQKFSTLDDLCKIGVYKNIDNRFPIVHEQIGYIKTDDDWKQLSEDYDVVVSTPNSSSPHLLNVAKPNENYFDLVFIDEAHHTSANIYDSILNSFKESKIILLTATPFRRDKKRIPGNLIYHYPISKAIQDGIYRVVKYFPVNTTIPESKKDNDLILAEYAKKKYQEEIKTNNDAKVLIKTDSISHAEKLIKVYKSINFNVELIHSKKTDKHNNKTVADCKDNKISGIICVGMVGEGLDIPTLKMAVLHKSPQTLPATIQFIGRLSRFNNQTGNSILISDPNFIEGEVKELYRYDDGWEKIIPKLIDRKIQNTTYVGRLGNQANYELSFSKNEINPFFTVTVYELLNGFTIKENYITELPSDIEYYILDRDDNDPYIFITKVEENIPWVINSLYTEMNHEIHIFYIKDNFLFEHTSSEFYSQKIRNILFNKDTYRKASSKTVIQGLKDTDGHYVMVGMANITGTTHSNPKYKTYMGNEIENSLRLTDGRNFTAGHALSKHGEDTRGIATKNSKIWSIKRDSLQKFIDWCDHLYTLIHLPDIDFQIPRMGMLAKSEIITEIPEEPISIYFDDIELQQNILKLYIENEDYTNPNIKISIVNMSLDKKSICCMMNLDFIDDPIECKYEIDQKGYWEVETDKQIRININMIDNKNKSYINLSEFLQDYSPLIILQSGRTIKNNVLFTPQVQNERFDQELFLSDKIDWDDTDIFKEAEEPDSKYKYNVQEKVISVISKGRDDKDYFFVDDSSGEVADIIWFNNTSTDKTIYFIHCKFKHRSSKADQDRTPNGDKKNITELIDQGIRCGFWIKSPNLISQLIGRLERTQKSKVLFNKEVEFRNFEFEYSPYDWKFKVILVQPGLAKEAVFKTSQITNIEKMLTTLFDRTRSINADLEIWGNKKS